MSTIWNKFVHNCAINPVSAIIGLRPGEIARNPSAAWIMEALLDEILAVVDLAGVELSERDLRAEIYDHAWERYNKPSMLQHLEGGRATEIDALNGALVRKAKALGIATPVNATIAAIVSAIEAQRRMRSDNPVLVEAVMEALARSNPRAGRWGANAGPKITPTAHQSPTPLPPRTPARGDERCRAPPAPVDWVRPSRVRSSASAAWPGACQVLTAARICVDGASAPSQCEGVLKPVAEQVHAGDQDIQDEHRQDEAGHARSPGLPSALIVHASSSRRALILGVVHFAQFGPPTGFSARSSPIVRAWPRRPHRRLALA